MSALGAARLEDPRWFQNKVKLQELKDVLGGKKHGTFAVCKQGTEYLLVHRDNFQSSHECVFIENLSQLFAEGLPFDLIKRIFNCTRPCFQHSSAGKTRSAQQKEKESYPEQIIEELQDPRIHSPVLSKEELIREFRGLPLGTFLITGNESDGFVLYWKRYSFSKKSEEIKWSALLMDRGQLYLKHFPQERCDSFAELQKRFNLDLPFVHFKQVQENRHADYLAMEEEALLPDDVPPPLRADNPVEDPRWFIDDVEKESLDFIAFCKQIEEQPDAFVVDRTEDHYNLIASKKNAHFAGDEFELVMQVPFRQTADGKIVDMSNQAEFPDFRAFIEFYGLNSNIEKRIV